MEKQINEVFTIFIKRLVQIDGFDVINDIKEYQQAIRECFRLYNNISLNISNFSNVDYFIMALNGGVVYNLNTKKEYNILNILKDFENSINLSHFNFDLTRLLLTTHSNATFTEILNEIINESY